MEKRRPENVIIFSHYILTWELHLESLDTCAIQILNIIWKSCSNGDADSW